MHLTNYAINKDSEDFIFNEDPDKDNVGHKRGLKAIFKTIDETKNTECERNSEQIW